MFFSWNFLSVGLVFVRIYELKEVVELGWDLRDVDIRFLIDGVVRDSGSIYGVVDVLEIEYMVVFLDYGFVV